MTEEEKKQAEEQPEEQPEEEKPNAEFSQDDVDRIVAERLEREKRKAERDREEAKRQAREKALQDQEDWKNLAEERTQTIEEKNQRIEELSGLETERDQAQERIDTLEKRLTDLIAPQFEAVPEHFREAFDEWTVERKADWLAKNAEKLTTTPPDRPAGSRPTGRAAQPPRQESDKEAREAQRMARVSSI